MTGSYLMTWQAISGASDVIWMHGWQGKRMRKVLSLARRAQKPVLMRGENTLKAMPDGDGLRGCCKKQYLKWIFNRCAAFLCIGTDNRDYYRSHGIDDTRLFSMPYAVDNAFFARACATARESRDNFRAGLGIPDGRPVILFAGKFIARKNPHVLLEAFRKLESPAHLLFVGGGEMESALHLAAQGYANITFAGFRNQSELPSFYDLADIFVLASHAEPWGLAVNEAMNAGCVPVVTDECGCASDLINKDTGVIVPPGEINDLAAALDHLLKEPDELAQMQQNARQRIAGWGYEQDIDGLREALEVVWRQRELAQTGGTH